MTKLATFDLGAEGWTTSNGFETHFATGGNSGGYLRGVEGGSGTWTFVAPADFLGNLEQYYGGTLQFDLIQNITTSQFDGPDVTLTGAGITLVVDAGDNPGTDWTSYSIDLELGGGWRIGSLTGSIASETVLRSVLADLTAFSIRGEFVNGSTNDTSGLDNVRITEGTPTPPMVGLPVVTSTFESGIDGWSFIADVREFRHVATDGNPGGYLEGVDFTTGATWYFVAADKFLGNKSGFYGGTLTYDLRQSALTSQFNAPDVILIGGGLQLVLDQAHPGTDWTFYDINLSTASDWRIDSETGAVATEADLRTVLADLSALQIRGEYISGADTAGLDNVVMAAAEIVTLVQASAPGSPVRFQTLEGAIAAAEAGSLITVAWPVLPRDTTGPVAVTANALTISTVAGYGETLALSGAARVLTLLGQGGTDVTGSAGADTIAGNSGDNEIDGGAGNDFIGGGAGNDRVLGGLGNDTLYGGFGNDTVDGGEGNDQIFGGGGRNQLFGGDGADFIQASPGGDLIGGGAGNDTIRGGDAADTIYGGLGDDNIGGGAGNDLIFGAAGANTIWGGLGNDTVQGGSGADEIYGGGNGTNQLFGNDGNDFIQAGAGGDFIGGGAGNDTIRGGNGNDTIYGGLGDDNIGGGAGNDVIFASAGANSVWGGLGNDTIHAGTGKDVLSGGPGADVFVFASAAHIGIGAGRDVISDFQSGVDDIDLRALNTTFNGTAGVLGGGQASFYYFAAGGLLIGDQNGNGAADWVIELSGAPGVTAGDFLL